MNSIESNIISSEVHLIAYLSFDIFDMFSVHNLHSTLINKIGFAFDYCPI